MPFKTNVSKYVKPSSLEDACEILKSDEKACAIAGGTAIFLFSVRGFFSQIDTFVDLEALDLHGIRKLPNSYEIGATTKLQDVLESELIRYDCLKSALLSIPREVRNMGTVGGEVYTAAPNFDLPVALMALNAMLKVTNGKNERTIKMDEFYSDVFSPNIERGFVIKAVQLPINELKTVYKRVSNTAHGFSLASLCVSLALEELVIKDITVAIGGSIDTPPTRLFDVEQELRGSQIDSSLLEKGAKKVKKSDFLKVSSDYTSSESYKRHLFAYLFKEALKEVVTKR
ncbi:hypothetical protein B9Q12_02470 [Candidatus Marsarchaeota G2 archaeon ECH_B_SAG-G06]|uniref:FAD-binding PCMH-type domain-containing protein n=2 Tax=Candidatus Marsarchaeota group 2 TaxID=2203771 RepID=A0A2R6C0M8_9ARCH|nr:MAG: hypothetical protein B9Q12_02470 [Candidatus Marsarchaeota G2 archaeon ECH_B_SAG-G06]